MIKTREKKQGKAGGFTLVEVLVVAVVFSIIGIGITTSFVSGVKIWRRSEDMARTYNSLILTLEKVSRDLRQSVVMPNIGFEAAAGDSAQEFSFPALIGTSIAKITYRFDLQEKTLLRNEVRYEDIISGKQKDNYTEKTMLKLDELQISYLYFDKVNNKAEWQDSWKKEDGVFRLIKLKGKYNGEEFTKIILIPIS